MREGDRVYADGKYIFSITDGWDGDRVIEQLWEDYMNWTVTRREPAAPHGDGSETP